MSALQKYFRTYLKCLAANKPGRPQTGAKMMFKNRLIKQHIKSKLCVNPFHTIHGMRLIFMFAIQRSGVPVWYLANFEHIFTLENSTKHFFSSFIRYSDRLLILIILNSNICQSNSRPILCCWCYSLLPRIIIEFISLLRFTNELSHFSFRENIHVSELRTKRSRYKSINLAQHTGTRYVGSTKTREKKWDAWNSFIERKKGEMMNDFVEWLMMCVELINGMIE